MMRWPREKVDELLRLLDQGMSAAQIAAELGPGFSRNAVIGKTTRLRKTVADISAPRGIPGPKPELQAAIDSWIPEGDFILQPVPEAALKLLERGKSEAEKDLTQEPLKITPHLLGSGGCSWLLNFPTTHEICGEPCCTILGKTKPYCRAHWRESCQPQSWKDIEAAERKLKELERIESKRQRLIERRQSKKSLQAAE